MSGIWETRGRGAKTGSCAAGSFWLDVHPRFLEDFHEGQVLAGDLGRTVTETDNVWFTCLTMNTNQLHFNTPYAAHSRFGRTLVNSTLTLALVTGLSVAHTSEHAVANLGWSSVRLPRPVFVGDTLWAETMILAARGSRSDPSVGIVTARSRGLNQRGEVVIEFERSFLVLKRKHADRLLTPPASPEPWPE
jgi:itaconyl-CoA hydratase